MKVFFTDSYFCSEALRMQHMVEQSIIFGTFTTT